MAGALTGSVSVSQYDVTSINCVQPKVPPHVEKIKYQNSAVF